VCILLFERPAVKGRRVLSRQGLLVHDLTSFNDITFFVTKDFPRIEGGPKLIHGEMPSFFQPAHGWGSPFFRKSNILFYTRKTPTSQNRTTLPVSPMILNLTVLFAGMDSTRQATP
jgi:hypothetical protein